MLEFILSIILEPIVTVIIGAPAEHLGDVLHNPKLSKGRKALIFILLFSIMTMVLTAIFLIVIGIVALIFGKNKDNKDFGLVM